MTIVHLGKIQGGKRGQRIVDVTQEIIRGFFALGVSNIEDECNNVSIKYRSIWNSRCATNLMDEYGLRITFEDGLLELDPSFKLFEPSTISINVLDSSDAINGEAAATITHVPHNHLNPVLTIYLEPLEVTDSTIRWKGFSKHLL